MDDIDAKLLNPLREGRARLLCFGGMSAISCWMSSWPQGGAVVKYGGASACQDAYAWEASGACSCYGLTLHEGPSPFGPPMEHLRESSLAWPQLAFVAENRYQGDREPEPACLIANGQLRTLDSMPSSMHDAIRLLNIGVETVPDGCDARMESLLTPRSEGENPWRRWLSWVESFPEGLDAESYEIKTRWASSFDALSSALALPGGAPAPLPSQLPMIKKALSSTEAVSRLSRPAGRAQCMVLGRLLDGKAKTADILDQEAFGSIASANPEAALYLAEHCGLGYGIAETEKMAKTASAPLLSIMEKELFEADERSGSSQAGSATRRL